MEQPVCIGFSNSNNSGYLSDNCYVATEKKYSCNDKHGICIGRQLNVNGQYNIVVGRDSNVTGNCNIVLGSNNTVNGNRNRIIGSNHVVTGDDHVIDENYEQNIIEAMNMMSSSTNLLKKAFGSITDVLKRI